MSSTTDLDPVSEAILRLHADDFKGVIATTGGGTGLIDRLWAPGGLSKTLFEAIFPYGRYSLVDLLGSGCDVSGTNCSEETAIRMAIAAYERAEELAQREGYKGSIFGLGMTAALATDPPRRGEDRVHVATFGPLGLRHATVSFEKAAGIEREFQGIWCDVIGVSALLDAAGLATLAIEMTPGVCSLQLASSDNGVSVRFTPVQVVPPEMTDDEFLARALHLTDGSSMSGAMLEARRHVLFPGSFNPRQYGHGRMARMAEAQTGMSVVFAITANHPDKGTLPISEMKRRREQFLWRNNVLFTKDDALYIQKARQFPGFSFLIGADALLGILNPKYYEGGEKGVLEALDEFEFLGTTFLVVGREVDGEFRTLRNINVPKAFRHLFETITGRWDIHSADLR